MEPDDIQKYISLNNTDISNLEKNYLSIIKNIDSIPFDKTISMMHDLNDLILVFYEKSHELKEKNLIDVVLIDDLQSLSFNVAKSSDNGFQDVLEHFNEMAQNIGVPVVLVSRTPVKSA